MNLKRCLKITGIVVVGLVTAKSIADIIKLMNKLKQYEEKALFKGAYIKYNEEPFEMDSVGSVCSGTKIDFTETEMADEEASLKLFARSSGVKIIIPKTWKVNLYGLINKADIKNATKEPDVPEHVLNIDYDLKYSGVLISNSQEEELEVEDIESEKFQDVELDVEDLDDNEQEETIEEVVEE